MKNSCLNITPNAIYIAIDYLYIEEFNGINCSSPPDFVGLRKHLFPYSHNPFALISNDNESICVPDIISPINSNDIDASNLKQFCSDSGVILLIATEDFCTVLNKFNVDNFVEFLEQSNFDLNNNVYKLGEINLVYFLTAAVNQDYAGGGNFEIF